MTLQENNISKVRIKAEQRGRKNEILTFRELVKFSPRIYIIDYVKFAKDFKLAKASNSKILLTQILLHQLLNSTV